MGGKLLVLFHHLRHCRVLVMEADLFIQVLGHVEQFLGVLELSGAGVHHLVHQSGLKMCFFFFHNELGPNVQAADGDQRSHCHENCLQKSSVD